MTFFPPPSARLLGSFELKNLHSARTKKKKKRDQPSLSEEVSSSQASRGERPVAEVFKGSDSALLHVGSPRFRVGWISSCWEPALCPLRTAASSPGRYLCALACEEGGGASLPISLKGKLRQVRVLS